MTTATATATATANRIKEAKRLTQIDREEAKAQMQRDVDKIVAAMSDEERLAYWARKAKADDEQWERDVQQERIRVQADLEDAKPGDGATHCLYSDRHAGTIIRKTKKTMWVQRDTATLLNGSTSGEADALTTTIGGFVAHTEGEQRHGYKQDPKGEVIRFSRRESETGTVNWVRSGVRVGERGGGLMFGRHEHYDFNY